MNSENKRFFGYHNRRPYFACGQAITIYPRLNIGLLLAGGHLRAAPRTGLSS